VERSSNRAKQFVAAYQADLRPALGVVGVEFWLTVTNNQSVNIEAFWSHTLRQAGRGGDALRQLCDMADAYSVSLTATVHPLLYGELDGEPEVTARHCERLDQQALSSDKLAAWYERFGFGRVEATDEFNPVMARCPGCKPESVLSVTPCNEDAIRIHAFKSGTGSEMHAITAQKILNLWEGAEETPDNQSPQEMLLAAGLPHTYEHIELRAGQPDRLPVTLTMLTFEDGSRVLQIAEMATAGAYQEADTDVASHTESLRSEWAAIPPGFPTDLLKPSLPTRVAQQAAANAEEDDRPLFDVMLRVVTPAKDEAEASKMVLGKAAHLFGNADYLDCWANEDPKRAKQLSGMRM
jgi:hypothetical protein